MFFPKAGKIQLVLARNGTIILKICNKAVFPIWDTCSVTVNYKNKVTQIFYSFMKWLNIVRCVRYIETLDDLTINYKTIDMQISEKHISKKQEEGLCCTEKPQIADAYWQSHTKKEANTNGNNNPKIINNSFNRNTNYFLPSRPISRRFHQEECKNHWTIAKRFWGCLMKLGALMAQFDCMWDLNSRLSESSAVHSLCITEAI